MEKKENKGEGKGVEDEGVFFRFGDDLAVDDNPHRSAAKQPLLADLLKVTI